VISEKVIKGLITLSPIT